MTSTVDSTPADPQLDPDKLMAFVFTAVGEVGATLNTALAVLGDKLGYYRALAERPGLTPTALAEATGTDARYAREWLGAQAAGGWVDHDPETGGYTLPLEHAVALTDPSSPAYLPGLFQLAVGTVAGSQRVLEAARNGSGVGWHEHTDDVHTGCERFFQPSYQAYLVAEWLPALDGVLAKLERGATVADIGCGHGASTILMARAFPASRFFGSDLHAESVRTAGRRAAEAGVGDRAEFEVASAQGFNGHRFDLVTTFDALHDMGDPVGAARRVREQLAADGTWMIVEPIAGDQVQDNLNPVGRTYYGFSTLLCTPGSLSQPVGAALGTQAGPARLRDVTTAAGFTRFRVAATTPFHMVLEVRP
ncbi:class I SAM-dependent methyltransferase [Nocardia sp. NBC_00511]|uniref:class I SAM-dependent methyltransferase n=1 Tax=Nocardia sp. NBC_00511 TaxID=2903591 RepID=UPI0030DE20AF